MELSWDTTDCRTDSLWDTVRFTLLQPKIRTEIHVPALIMKMSSSLLKNCTREAFYRQTAFQLSWLVLHVIHPANSVCIVCVCVCVCVCKMLLPRGGIWGPSGWRHSNLAAVVEDHKNRGGKNLHIFCQGDTEWEDCWPSCSSQQEAWLSGQTPIQLDPSSKRSQRNKRKTKRWRNLHPCRFLRKLQLHIKHRN